MKNRKVRILPKSQAQKLTQNIAKKLTKIQLNRNRGTLILSIFITRRPIRTIGNLGPTRTPPGESEANAQKGN
jgi:hypothetical protein